MGGLEILIWLICQRRLLQWHPFVSRVKRTLKKTFKERNSGLFCPIFIKFTFDNFTSPVGLSILKFYLPGLNFTSLGHRACTIFWRLKSLWWNVAKYGSMAKCGSMVKFGHFLNGCITVQYVVYMYIHMFSIWTEANSTLWGQTYKLWKLNSVCTSFVNLCREQLREEWALKQEKLKNEEIEITYSYWDGSGHRRQVRMKKGNSIQQFLQKCLEGLRREFNDLKSVTVDQLMYIKEDLIIAHHYTFYDFIVTKARGKSGPLFSFDVHDDIRLVNDASVEKDESHAGKVCLRSWYERNKHIFPASRWEPYDPEKRWDSYTVSDKNAIKITVK